jgi:hypothetical protein
MVNYYPEMPLHVLLRQVSRKKKNHRLLCGIAVTFCQVAARPRIGLTRKADRGQRMWLYFGEE